MAATTYFRFGRGEARAAMAAELVEGLKRLDRRAGVALVFADRRVRVTRLGDTFHVLDDEGRPLGVGDPAAVAAIAFGAPS